jgi:hypothetical protein
MERPLSEEEIVERVNEMMLERARNEYKKELI